MSDSASSMGNSSSRPQLLPDEAQRIRLRRKRAIKDSLSRYGIGTAGIGVVFALMLIFVYLFSEVAPMFKSASLTSELEGALPGISEMDRAGHVAMERYQELGVTYSKEGRVTFFEIDTGNTRLAAEVPMPEDARTTVVATAESRKGVIGYGFDNGQMSVVRHNYSLTYPNDQRYITPSLEFPLGEAPVTLDPEGQAIKVLAVQEGAGGSMYAAAATEDGRLVLTTFRAQRNLMTGQTTIQTRHFDLPIFDGEPRHMLINDRFRHLYVADDRGFVHHYAIHDLNDIRLTESVKVSEQGTVTAMDFLVGTVSVIVGTSNGELSQWIPVRDTHNQYFLTKIRTFASYPGEILTLAPEYTRKGFWAADSTGRVGIHHGTASQDLLQQKVSDNPIERIAISPRNNRVMFLDGAGNKLTYSVWNEHPEISFSSLWRKVWYEGRSEAEYVWQSSSGSDEFEPKMSLVPLSVGTIKAAFYAMLFAAPLALMGAIYTAYFMTPKLRGLVKPTIEVMEALPTVILGFLAGLWLAPFIESHLPAVFGILILMPVGMLLFALAWTQLVPADLRNRIPPGWEAAMLVPVVIFIGWVCVSLSPSVEVVFFNGSARQWLTDVGITYDQRNALVVGIAMGFAVIPTIFSIAEDAVFNVPKHLTQGSLALGATPWQTMMGVVLPTASPGIFSALMMGLGRAVGETMIVLMATGNSPIVNFNIFEGMRTLSANIAVELPETAVGSSHFRVLFLAALVLLALTFVVNTIAEIVRQRLRARYSNL